MNYLTIAVVGALLAAGAAADRFLPVVGANARIEHFKAERDGWWKNATAWRAYGEAEGRAFKASEHLRAVEQDLARIAVTEQAKSCEARVDRARLSAAAIQSIVTKEIRRDPQGCPLRSLVDPRELRDAVAPTGRR